MGMAEAGGISLTLAVKDCVQSANRKVITGISFKLGMFFISGNVFETENPLQVSGTTRTPLSSSVWPTEPTGGKMSVIQFGINSLNNTKTFNYRSNFQHFLKHLPFSSAACQPNADTWEKSSPWCSEPAERQVHTTFCLCSILHILFTAAILKHQFHKNLSWIDSVCPGFEPAENSSVRCFACKCRSLKTMSNYMKVKWDITDLPKWKLRIYKHYRKQTWSDFSGHNYTDNDKDINKTLSTLCICLRHTVSATDL